MSRSGYSEDLAYEDPLQHGRWRAQVKSATRGKRGQRLLRDLVAALDAMEVKELHQRILVADDGCCCAMGAVLKHRGVQESYIQPAPNKNEPYWEDAFEERNQEIAGDLDVAHQLVAEIVDENDEMPLSHKAEAWGCTEEEARWRWMRSWAAARIVDDKMDGVSISDDGGAV